MCSNLTVSFILKVKGGDVEENTTGIPQKSVTAAAELGSEN